MKEKLTNPKRTPGTQRNKRNKQQDCTKTGTQDLIPTYPQISKLSTEPQSMNTR